MEVLRRTLGAPPANQSELYERQLRAHQLGGIRPSAYNWLVFGRTPGAVIPLPVYPPDRPAIESLSGDAPSTVLKDR